MSDHPGQDPSGPFALRPRALSDTLSDVVPDLSESADARSGRDLLSKVVLRRFRVDAFLDGGSVGRIYRGIEISTGRPVAIKVLRRQEGPRNELSKKRFIREAEFLASIQHQNVVELIDHGMTNDGDAVMVMELLDGHTLRRHIDETGPMPVIRVLWIAIQLGRALARAHEMGGVHRDLKPANVFLERDAQDRDVVKVLDFGLVKPTQTSADESLTISGFVMGTPVYMSPEQAEGGGVDARSDIYSFGVMLFEMITGVPPFHGETIASILTGHLDQPVPRLVAKYPMVDCPPTLELVIRQCLAKRPIGRPDSMASLVRQLEDILGMTNVLPEPPEVPELPEAPEPSPFSRAPDFSDLANWDPNVSTSDLLSAELEAPMRYPSPGPYAEVTTPGSPTAWLARSQEIPLHQSPPTHRRGWMIAAWAFLIATAMTVLYWIAQTS